MSDYYSRVMTLVWVPGLVPNVCTYIQLRPRSVVYTFYCVGTLGLNVRNNSVDAPFYEFFPGILWYGVDGAVTIANVFTLCSTCVLLDFIQNMSGVCPFTLHPNLGHSPSHIRHPT
jgi:hypothetical protein